jgi:hypothetical protein
MGNWTQDKSEKVLIESFLYDVIAIIKCYLLLIWIIIEISNETNDGSFCDNEIANRMMW